MTGIRQRKILETLTARRDRNAFPNPIDRIISLKELAAEAYGLETMKPTPNQLTVVGREARKLAPYLGYTTVYLPPYREAYFYHPDDEDIPQVLGMYEGTVRK